MQSALQMETKVLPGNKIEINLPADIALTSVGQTVEVISDTFLLDGHERLLRSPLAKYCMG